MIKNIAYMLFWVASLSGCAYLNGNDQKFLANMYHLADNQAHECQILVSRKISCRKVALEPLKRNLSKRYGKELWRRLSELKECSYYIGDFNSIICSGGEINSTLKIVGVWALGHINLAISIDGDYPWQDIFIMRPTPVDLCDNLIFHQDVISEVQILELFHQETNGHTFLLCPRSWRDGNFENADKW